MELANNVAVFTGQSHSPSEHCDPVLDNLVSALRATVAHPELSAITKPWLREVHRIQINAAGSASLAVISDHVAFSFRIAPDDMSSRKRDVRTAFARQIAAYLCRELTGAPFEKIAAHLGRDHSTIIYACNLIARRMTSEPGFRRTVEQMARELAPGTTTNVEPAPSAGLVTAAA